MVADHAKRAVSTFQFAAAEARKAATIAAAEPATLRAGRRLFGVRSAACRRAARIGDAGVADVERRIVLVDEAVVEPYVEHHRGKIARLAVAGDARFEIDNVTCALVRASAHQMRNLMQQKD